MSVRYNIIAMQMMLMTFSWPRLWECLLVTCKNDQENQSLWPKGSYELWMMAWKNFVRLFWKPLIVGCYFNRYKKLQWIFIGPNVWLRRSQTSLHFWLRTMKNNRPSRCSNKYFGLFLIISRNKERVSWSFDPGTSFKISISLIRYGFCFRF